MLNHWLAPATSLDLLFVIVLLTTTAVIIRSHEVVQDDVLIRFYGKGISSQYSQFFVKDGIYVLENNNDYDSSKSLIIVIHGAGMNADQEVIRYTIDTFRESGKLTSYNIMALHSAKPFEVSWEHRIVLGVMAHAEPVGVILGDFLKDMVTRGLTEPERIFLWGYSLGAHVAGYAARQVNRVHHKRVEYIAGLDPAGVGFQLLFGMVPISSDDARIVHVYHTNARAYGHAHQAGKADFVFNGGMLQPGCFFSFIGCSHSRSVMYFLESLERPNAFVGRRCGNVASFSLCQCNNLDTARAAFPPDESAIGKYYIRTRSDSPYGMGVEGATCVLRTWWGKFWG